MFTEATKSPTTAKRSRRSTSPRAVELRRLQNRIAQRNHRRRVRESNQARQETEGPYTSGETQDENQQTSSNKGFDTRGLSQQKKPTDSSSEHRVEHINAHTFASSYPGSPPFFSSLANNIENMIMAEDMLAQQEKNLPYMDLMMRTIPENENRMSQSSITLQNCTCNAATGPCPSHLEKIRAQLLAETSSSIHHSHQHQQRQSHHLANSDITRPHPLPPSPISHYSHSTVGSETDPPPLFNPHGGTSIGHAPPPPPSIISHMSKFSSGMSSYMSSPREFSPTAQSDTPPEPLSMKGRMSAPTVSAAENTRRFSIVLEAMRTAGFHDFDEMALVYYTARFEVGSFPAMAQCASRSRRMKAMLLELQESSLQWPRWESRALYESVSEATVSICVQEMERLIKAQIPNHALQSEPGNLINAFEWLLESSGHGKPSILDELKLSGKLEAALDEMPYLWSLLTELAGSRGLYCDRIARIIMVILLYARRT